MESLYKKLKKSIGKTAVISYYTDFKTLKTETVKIWGIRNFDMPSCMQLIVTDKNLVKDMYFFSKKSLIKSITLLDTNDTIFFNPYIEKHLNQEYSDPLILKAIIEKDYFSNTPVEEIISKKELFLIKHYSRGKFKFEDLFCTEKQKQEFDLFFSLLIKDLTRYAKNNNLDYKLKKIDNGSTSLIYSIGDKIIKIGKVRDNSVIPYCEYLLQPIMNQYVLFDNIPIRIEVTERVVAYRNLPEEDQKNMKDRFEQAVIEFIKKLNKIGLKCHDLNIYNIGILTKDNTIHYDTIPFDVGSEEITSIKNNNGLRIHKKGEFVILDLDAIEIVNYRKYCNYLRKIGYITDKKTIKTEDYGKQLTIKYVD